MNEYINGPVLAASLDNLKYLVFEGMAGKAPRISLETYHFEVYDNETGEWVDTGVSAVNGAPGYTPTVSAERTENCVMLTISDGRPNGTTRTYLIQDGQDYVLTEADKQEICNLLNDGVPQLVTDWLDANVSPAGSAAVVDASLTIRGAAADAAAAGTRLEALEDTAAAISGAVLEGTRHTGLVITVEDASGIASVASEDRLTFVGDNIFDATTKVGQKIINDSGTEISDSSSHYYAQYIPVHGKSVTANFKIQRFYYYDENKQLLSRPTGHAAGTTETFPDTVYFVRIQLLNSEETETMCMKYGSGLPAYSQYRSAPVFSGFSGGVSIFGDGVNDINVTLFAARVKPTIEIDETLTVSGDAADAAATGEKISSLRASIADLEELVLNKEQISENIITLSADQTENVVRIESEDNVTFVGENIFDISTAVPGKILNNSGVETADSASYYCTQMIPVHGKTVKSNNKIQRFYYYDENRQFLERSGSYDENTEISFPSNVYFVQIQIEKRYEIENKCVIYGSGTPTYTPFRQSDTFSGFDGGVSIFGDGVNSVAITVYSAPEKEDEQPIPAIGTYPFWEPDTATDAYKCTPLGTYTQSIPALTDTLKYQGFLETYFDVYLGTHADGYRVTREDLGLDSGAAAADHIASPVYSYTFAPKRYNRTVLLSAGMNTNEASTYFGLAYFIKALMEHTEDGMLALYQSTRFIVIPVICPSGIAHDPLLYKNSNNARINKNFEYYGSWERLKSDGGGTYPDSEVETRMLKYWLNKYAGADFYLDCHSDAGSQPLMLHLGSGFCSDAQTAQKLAASKQDIIDYYRGKGYFGASDTPTLGFGALAKETAIYPKTVYAKEVTNIPACMFEQFLYTTAWGSDGATNNDAYGIKHYAAMIRYMVLTMVK